METLSCSYRVITHNPLILMKSLIEDFPIWFCLLNVVICAKQSESQGQHLVPCSFARSFWNRILSTCNWQAILLEDPNFLLSYTSDGTPSKRRKDGLGKFYKNLWALCWNL